MRLDKRANLWLYVPNKTPHLPRSTAAMNNTKVTSETLQMRVDSYGTVLAYADYTLAVLRQW